MELQSFNKKISITDFRNMTTQNVNTEIDLN